MTSSKQADLICELRAGARELDAQHALSLAAGVLHDLANDALGERVVEPGRMAQLSAALGAARVAAYGTSEADPDWNAGASVESVETSSHARAERAVSSLRAAVLELEQLAAAPDANYGPPETLTREARDAAGAAKCAVRLVNGTYLV